METSNRDQTDDLLKDTLYTLETIPSQELYARMQQKRKQRKQRLFVWWTIAASLILASMLFFVQYFTGTEPALTHGNTQPGTVKEKEMHVSTTQTEKNTKVQKQTILPQPSAQPLITEPVAVAAHASAKSHNKAGTVRFNTTTVKTQGSNPSQQNMRTPVNNTLPASLNTQVKSTPADTDRGQSLQLESPELPAFQMPSVSFEALAKDTNKAVQVCDEVIIPPSVLQTEKPAKLCGQTRMFVYAQYAQLLYNNLRVNNSSSLLYFGDSSANYDMPQNSAVFQLGIGYAIIPRLYISTGISVLRIQYAHITNVEKKEMFENASISSLDPGAFRTYARYFDEKLFYMQIPLLFHYQIPVSRFQYSVAAGPQYTRLYKTSTYSTEAHPSSGPDHINNADSERFRRNLWSLQLQADVAYFLLPSLSVGAGIYMQQNMNTAFQSLKYEQRKNLSAGLQLGIKYYF